MKKTLLVGILLIPLMLMTNQIAYGGGEGPAPGSTEKLVGPTIDAVLGLINSTVAPGYVALLLSGICNGTPFSVYDPDYLPGDVEGINAGDLINQRVEISGICNNNTKYVLNCINVKNFAKADDNSMIIADVVIVFVVPR
jgi:hypothetical protein